MARTYSARRGAVLAPSRPAIGPSDEAQKGAYSWSIAIGYTDESDLQLWLKRGFALASAWGVIMQVTMSPLSRQSTGVIYELQGADALVAYVFWTSTTSFPNQPAGSSARSSKRDT